MVRVHNAFTDYFASRTALLATKVAMHRSASFRAFDRATKLTRSASRRITNHARSAKEAGVRFKDHAVHETRTMANYARSAGRRTVRKLQKRPLCLKIMQNFYHRYGMKHVLLILVLLFYAFFGAFVFLILEAPTQNRLKDQWAAKIAQNRSDYVISLMDNLFNNSRFLIYIKGRTSDRVHAYLYSEMAKYERQLNIKWSDQKMEWDYWNAVLFAGTICTTIGYGHIYPHTKAGKIATMVYALGGIPLVLLVLQDLGRLLTMGMKYPWFQFKRGFRRSLRYCTKQSMREIYEIEEDEREKLNVFDLPVPVGVALIVLWVWFCSITFSFYDTKWTLLESFYFFFISLSTVGLGDLVPSHPRLLLMMFGLVLIGLSLVSMVINLMQMKMRKTYEAGKDQQTTGSNPSLTADLDQYNVTALGILHCLSTPDVDGHSMAANNPESASMRSILRQERTSTRATQTNLSLPTVRQVVLTADGVHWITNWAYSGLVKSPDEVTNLVESDTDVYVMSDLGEMYQDETTGDSLVQAYSDLLSDTDPIPLVNIDPMLDFDLLAAPSTSGHLQRKYSA